MQYPASLLQAPLRASFADAAPETVIRSQNDSGPRKARQRYTAAERPLSCTVLLRSQAEKDLLDNWFQYTLAGGALPFAWPALGPALGERQLLLQGNFLTSSVGNWTAFGGAPVEAGNEPPNSYLIVSASDVVELASFPVTPGERLFCRCRIWSGPTLRTVRFGVTFLDAAGGYASEILPCSIPGGMPPTDLSGSGVVPAAAAFGRGLMNMSTLTGQPLGYCTIGNLMVSRVATDRQYQVVAGPTYRLAGARVWTADLQLVRLP